MSEYKGANSSNTIGSNLKEVYDKKKKFKKINNLLK